MTELRQEIARILCQCDEQDGGAAWDLFDANGKEHYLERADAILPLISKAEQRGAWQSIKTAKKDGTIIWAVLRSDIYPNVKPERPDLERWNGAQVPLRHYGLADDGFDIGWGVAAPVGCGGFPDEWIAGWQPLPAPPLPTEEE